MVKPVRPLVGLFYSKAFLSSFKSLGRIQVRGKKLYSCKNDLWSLRRFLAKKVFLAIWYIAGKWLIF
jgi:hypothetical protein